MTKIKGPTDAELRQAVELGEEFWYQTELSKTIPYNHQSVYTLSKIADEDGMFFVAVDEGKVVGFAFGLVTPFPFNQDYKAATEVAWYITPEYRKDGTGLALAEILELTARLKGATYLSMMLIEEIDPGPVAAMYEHLGYSKSERTYIKVL